MFIEIRIKEELLQDRKERFFPELENKCEEIVL
jgi:hypothetical protein